jgi:Protein of unknown function (DUF2917).
MEGAVWVTRDRDSVDYVFSAGQSLQFKGLEPVVVFAIQVGLLLVEPAEGP